MDIIHAGAEKARWTVVLAHGAGQPADSPFMTFFAENLVNEGAEVQGIRVVRFDFPYMSRARQEGRRLPPDRQPRLLEAWQQVIESLSVDPRYLLIGGKSMGGRMASLIADQVGAAGLICLGYPFHPPAKPDNLRIDHLQTLKTPALFCQGERDGFGKRDEIVGYDLSPTIQFHWLPDGDHGFKPRKASGLTEQQNRQSAVNAIVEFIHRLRPLT